MPDPTDLIVRQSDPPNLESPFHQLDEPLTPTGQFYVRSHFPVPNVDLGRWRLEVRGLANTLSLSLEELRALPPRSLTATLECAGNGRAFLCPAVPGVPWGLGAVSTAEWTGAPLASVLALAQVDTGAVDVVLEGADKGTLGAPTPTPGEIRYARSVPLAKARTDVLLAYEMNGAALTPEHGAPLRAVVPGWYGMASVKWLSTVHITAAPFQGFFQTLDYACWESKDGLPPVLTPLGPLQTKAQIARPAPHETLPADQPYEVYGAAWTGCGTVEEVEVSADGGRSWAGAELLDPPQLHVWRRWRYLWHTPAEPGAYTLLARATDSQGQTQPPDHDPGRGSYMITLPLRIPVTVGGNG